MSWAENKRRLFFALWPDEAMLEALAKLCQGLDLSEGKPVERGKFHITLVFLGEVPEDKIEALKMLAEKLTFRPCELTFNRLEHWVRPAVLCLTAEAVPEPLAELVEELKRGVRKLGCKLERRPFRPHLTLARKVRKRVAACTVDPIRWPVRELALVASELTPEGSRYQVLGRWKAAV
jgi:2'-5' RNA ligase